MPTPIAPVACCDLRMYVIKHAHIAGVPDETFVIGMQGVELNVDAVLADVTAKMAPTDSNAARSMPTGEKHFSATVNALVALNDNGGVYVNTDPDVFIETLQHAISRDLCKFVIELFPGTSPLFTDRECFKGSGWLKNLKLNASNNKEAATYSAEFSGTAIPVFGTMQGLVILPTP